MIDSIDMSVSGLQSAKEHLFAHAREIKGFPSELRLESGINLVVGPNGSGKSTLLAMLAAGCGCVASSAPTVSLQTVRDAADDITRMLVLDAFLPNDDRHASNVLFRRVGQRWRALAFDWSRARWFEPWPWGQHCNSAQFAGWLRTMGRLQPAAAQDCAHALQTIPTETVLESILAAPAPWRDNIDIDAVGDW
jgi:hypothetical protein